METRKLKEKEFHNVAFRDLTREKVDKYYSIWGRTIEFYQDRLAARCKGKKVLEYGCGTGSQSFFLAQMGAEVTGIDISDIAIQKAREEARAKGLVDITYEVMDAESLTFQDHSFDIVCGSGILHHLNLTRAFSEIARTLLPQGEGIFIEPLGHNPLINLYRRLTPGMRTKDEHPLLVSDLELAQQYFSSIDIHYFNLTTLMAVPLRGLPIFNRLLQGLQTFDDRIFRSVPLARRFAWIAAVTLQKPLVRPYQ
jgi:ubiquinone/menaquinone biosynthesis C-methylase UbiE